MHRHPAALLLLLVLLAAVLVACGSPTTETADAEPGSGLDNGSFDAELNGHSIHYEIHGAGPALMVLPNSWGFDVRGLRGVYAPLEDHFTMVYFDPRGMGGSGPVVEESDMGLEAVRVDFDALRAHLGLERVNAIGWSNGAMNLLLLASERPEILESAIFAHGSPSYTEEDFQRIAQEYPQLIEAYGALQQKFADPAMPVEEKTALMHRAWIEEFFPLSCADAEAMLPVLRETFVVESFSWRHSDYANRSSPTFDARDRLGRITARSLIIAGAHDTMPPEKAEEMRDGIAGSTLVVLENSGHFGSLEEPQRFVQVVVEFVGAE